jgi:Rrf2 family protein
MLSYLRISEAAALALHTLGQLAKSDGRSITNIEIAEKLDVSEHHLAKVHQKLVRAGILKAVRGPSGGFRLASPASEIRLIDAVEAVEGSFAPHECLLGRPKCVAPDCVMGKLSRTVNEEVRNFLTSTTVAQL